MEKLIEIEVDSKYCKGAAQVVLTQYAAAPHGLAIRLIDMDGMPLATCTTNVPWVNLAPDRFLIKNWAENEGLAESLIEQNVIVDTGERIPVGFCMAWVCKLHLRLLNNESDEMRANWIYEAMGSDGMIPYTAGDTRWLIKYLESITESNNAKG